MWREGLGGIEDGRKKGGREEGKKGWNEGIKVIWKKGWDGRQ